MQLADGINQLSDQIESMQRELAETRKANAESNKKLDLVLSMLMPKQIKAAHNNQNDTDADSKASDNPGFFRKR